MRNHADFMRPQSAITAATYTRLVALLEAQYPGKVRRTVEVCPVAIVKCIDNEHDALMTIGRLERRAEAEKDDGIEGGD